VRLPADYLDRIMFHPTLTIRGLHSGFVGAEANTIIPHTATVAIDVRMVKNQRWSTVYRRLLDHIRAQGFTVLESAEAPLPDALRGRAVRVVSRGGYDPAKTSLDLPISREIVAAVECSRRPRGAACRSGRSPTFSACRPCSCPTPTPTTASTARTST